MAELKILTNLETYKYIKEIEDLFNTCETSSLSGKLEELLSQNLLNKNLKRILNTFIRKILYKKNINEGEYNMIIIIINYLNAIPKNLICYSILVEIIDKTYLYTPLDEFRKNIIQHILSNNNNNLLKNYIDLFNNKSKNGNMLEMRNISRGNVGNEYETPINSSSPESNNLNKVSSPSNEKISKNVTKFFNKYYKMKESGTNNKIIENEMKKDDLNNKNRETLFKMIDNKNNDNNNYGPIQNNSNNYYKKNTTSIIEQPVEKPKNSNKELQNTKTQLKTTPQKNNKNQLKTIPQTQEQLPSQPPPPSTPPPRQPPPSTPRPQISNNISVLSNNNNASEKIKNNTSNLKKGNTRNAVSSNNNEENYKSAISGISTTEENSVKTTKPTAQQSAQPPLASMATSKKTNNLLAQVKQNSTKNNNINTGNNWTTGS
jgi:hypothetical protein